MAAHLGLSLLIASVAVLMVLPGATLGVSSVSASDRGSSDSVDGGVPVSPCTADISIAGGSSAGAGCSTGVAAPSPNLVKLAPAANPTADNWPELHLSNNLSGFDPNSTLSTLNASKLGVAWATDIYGPALDSPVVAYDPILNKTLAYIGNEYGDVEAVNVANGQIIWGNWLGSGIRSTPLVNDGDLYVATFQTPAIYKLNATTGAVECSRVTTQTIEATPTIATPPGGVRTLYIGTQGTSVNGPFLAINAANCTLEWQFSDYHTPGTGSWDSASYGVSASGVPMVLFGSDDPDSSVYALNALTGQLLWRFQCYNPNNGDWDVAAGVLISSPGVNGFAQGVAYTTNKIGRAYALDLNNGTLIWETNFNALAGVVKIARSTPALDGVNLVFGFHDGLFDLNALTGAEIWHYNDTTQTESISSPAIAGRGSDAVVVTGDIAGAVNVVSLATGTSLYQYQTGGYITASPAIVGGNIIIASSDGFLYDFAVGGGNAQTLPATTISYPRDSSSLANPDGNESVAGNATDSTGVTAVEVAVQSGGGTGPWWDAATGAWDPGPVNNLATLAAPGAKLSSWSFSYPVPKAGGTYEVTAYAVASSGQSDIVGADSGFSVLFSTQGANIQVSPSFAAPGATVVVSGGGFADSEAVNISLAGQTITKATATDTGALPSTNVKIPTTAAFDRSSLKATGVTSGKTAAVALVIGNSWDQLGYDPAHTGFEPNDTILNFLISFDRKWVHLAWHFDPGTAFSAAPAVVDGVAYLGDTTGQLYAVDIHNGGLLWTWTLASGAALNGSPAVDPALGLVFVTGQDGSLNAISTTTGLTVWSVSVGGELTPPAYVDGEIYVASTLGTVDALTESTGALTWSVSLGSAITGAPAVDPTEKRLVVGTSNGDILALNLTTGASTWTFAAGGAVTAAVTVAAETVFAGSANGNVYALSELTGAKLWSYLTGGPITDTGAYTTKGNGADGAELVIGSHDGNLYFLSATTGVLNYDISYGSPIVGVATAYGVVVLETASGVISSDRTFGPHELWVYKTHAPLTSSPVIVDGAIYVAAHNGNLYAFTTYGQAPE
ncbi:MAG: PQQ-binding-like beta-propeller repeat protein [Thermoplasmata archaeon]